MIKFFRKIRQRLLTENKVSKYLIYAIGEIALVMIGILLALQVNNWNEKRKAENIEKSILYKFIENLNSDNDAFKAVQLEIKQINDLHTNLYLIGIENKDIEDIGNPILIRRLPQIGILTKDNFANISHQLSNETIRNSIAEYYNDLNIFISINNELREIVENKVRPILGNENVYDLKEWFSNQTTSTRSSNFISKKRLVDLSRQASFQQLLIQANIKLRSLSLTSEWLIETNDNLKEIIQAELKKY